MKKLQSFKNRRQFLQYLVTGTAGTLAISLLFPKSSQSRELDLEQLCSLFPYNSRCENYLPGVQAKDSQGNAIEADKLIASSTPGMLVPVEGLPEITYLIITEKPAIAEYAIKPLCTHQGCTVEWKADRNQFVCPCHGSRYDERGRVIKGPAERPLPLVTVVVRQNQVRLADRKPAIDPR